MVKIRSLEELSDYIDNEWAWRRKELETIKMECMNSRQHQASMFARAGTALLYAHWEGFVKLISQGYVSYIDRRKERLTDLQLGLVALAHKNMIKAAGLTGNSQSHKDLVTSLVEGLASRAEFPDDCIDTKSNLNYATFANILVAIGLEDGPYVLKKTLIDDVLLDRRNAIAHGDRRDLRRDEFIDLHDSVVPILIQFKEDVARAAESQSFRRTVGP